MGFPIRVAIQVKAVSNSFFAVRYHQEPIVEPWDTDQYFVP
jgi:hypothetical protein